MAGRSRRLYPIVGAVHPRIQPLGGQFTITAAGAILSQDGALIAGGTVTKNAAAGRYDIVFYRTFKRVLFSNGAMEGPASAAFPTITGSAVRTRSVTGDGYTIQFLRTDTQADADAASGTVVRWFAQVSDS